MDSSVKVKNVNLENDKKRLSINYWTLFQFATVWEKYLFICGILFAALSAACWPLLIIVYGEFTTVLIDRSLTRGVVSSTKLLRLFGGAEVIHNATDTELRDAIEADSLAYLIGLIIVAVLQIITAILFVNLFNKVALKQITRIRIHFFRSILCQEMAWHDNSTDMNFASRITDDIGKIRDGISEKLGMFISLTVGFVVLIGISISYGLKISVVVIAYIPLLLISNYVVLKFQSKITTKELDAYSFAGSVAEEVLQSIRTVVAFGGETKEFERYSNKLQSAQNAGRRKGVYTGIGDAIVRFLFYICTALAFWYGIQLILDDRELPDEDKHYTPATLMIAFFGIAVGADNLARSTPFLSSFSTAVGSAKSIFNVIDRKSKIDPTSGEGHVIRQGMKGEIEFEDVEFRYPSRPDVQVLKSFNLKIGAGQTVALVGHSGCGKSTIVQLLQRFYDTDSGSIFIDKCKINTLNTSWLRANIAVVGQEPVLFATSIENNIRYGNINATGEAIIEAARSAGVHDFIMQLPDGYATQVGELGSQLSGGQKQRIAIARAIIQNPKILLLDEATSALDPHTGKLVEEMLNKVAKGRTTIIVTHKLTNIQKADQIVLMEKGVILEKGTHIKLMNMHGKYFNLVKTDENFANHSEMEKSNDENEKENEIRSEKELRKPSVAYENIHFKTTKLDKEIPEESFNHWSAFVRIFKMSRPEWGKLFLGCIGAALVGGSYPTYSVIIGNIYGSMSLPNPDDVRSETNLMCVAFLIVAVIIAISAYLQNYMLNLTGVNLMATFRKKVFQSMVKQEMAWFDDDSHSVGALCASLSEDGTNVRSAVEPIGGIVGSLATILSGVIVSMFYSWKLALVCIAFVPLVVVSVYCEAKFMTASMLKEKAAIERATQIATEAISNIRTVASLRQEEEVIERYTTEILEVEKAVKKKLSLRGYVFAAVQAIPMFGYAVALFYGGILVAREGVPYQDLIKVSESLIFGASMMGQSLAFISTLTAGIVAGSRLLKLIDREPKIGDSKSAQQGSKSDDESFVTFDKVNFSYPSRPAAKILKNIDLEILSGKTVALVGPSGCGKSTCVQLLQRLYDPDSGKILYNDSNISSDLLISDLRSKIGIVSQEPHLFDKTIAENIAYGDNSRKVSMEEIIAAAKMANIHNFIASLPLGYDTNLGARGTQLSGGQKQRVAIARALVRNPKILLLDEATSALDRESEKIVQQALDLAKTGRTCLIIAHRLTTIVNADLICVVQNGRIAEMGTHEELMEQKGLYTKLHSTQAAAM